MINKDGIRRAEIAKRIERDTKKIHNKMAIERMRYQFDCSHRKGTLTFMPQSTAERLAGEDSYQQFLPKLPPFEFDFAVIKHTFVNGSEIIKCMRCNRQWKNTDPDYAQANLMVQYSSNRPSSSEQLIRMPLPMMPQGAPAVAAALHKGFWSRFINALKDRFKPNKVTEESSVEYHDKL